VVEEVAGGVLVVECVGEVLLRARRVLMAVVRVAMVRRGVAVGKAVVILCSVRILGCVVCVMV
jgi:hypothetical protein